MQKFRFLKKCEKISLVAPSFGCTTEPYLTRTKVAIQNFQDLGYKVDVGPNVFINKLSARSNTARKCAKEFMDAYSSDSSLIISVGGGEIMCEILPFIDFKRLKKMPPKIFMGFSDNTNLTYTLTTISEVPTIYGPNFQTFAFLPFKNSTLDAYNLLTNKTKSIKGYPKWERYPNREESIINPLSESHLEEDKILKIFPKNKDFDVTGRLLGGCLDCLVTLCGTRFDETKSYLEKYREDGFIWFLEACDLNSLSIERALFQLKEAGWFKYVKGFVFGRPLSYKQRILGIDHYKAIKDIIKDLNVPYIIDADLGHFDPSMPFITGERAHIYTKNGNINVTYLDL